MTLHNDVLKTKTFEILPEINTKTNLIVQIFSKDSKCLEKSNHIQFSLLGGILNFIVCAALLSGFFTVQRELFV